MDKIRIEGGHPLKGTIQISGAKNACLPLMTASLLSFEPLTLENVPHLADVTTLTILLEHIGVKIEQDHPNILRLTTPKTITPFAPYDLVRKMRASVLVLGPLLARFGEAKVSLPGGCAIGSRPVDLHLYGLEKMGAHVQLEQGYIIATAPKGLHGAMIDFHQVSVGATENILMAATLAKGETHIKNAAQEPEIVDLAQCLRKMGAHIEGEGSSDIFIRGVDALHHARHRVISDRIETASFAIATAITEGEVTLTHPCFDWGGPLHEIMVEAGIVLRETEHGLNVTRGEPILSGIDIITEPFPGFPTDVQAQMMAYLCLNKGVSRITENIFENRFMHVPELSRMGADISLINATAHITGVHQLKGAEIMATDLRASISLIIAALAAEGESVLHRVYHLDRGYENVEQKLSQCGAHIQRIKAD